MATCTCTTCITCSLVSGHVRLVCGHMTHFFQAGSDEDEVDGTEPELSQGEEEIHHTPADTGDTVLVSLTTPPQAHYQYTTTEVMESRSILSSAQSLFFVR